MAGILGGYSDSTCNSHNALRNISAYACGVTISFKDSNNPPDMHYAVISVQECCNMVGAPVMRIPGNTGCEMQFCDVPLATSSFSRSVIYGYATGSGTAAQTPAPTVTQGSTIGPPDDVQNCMRFVYEGDLPDDIAKDVTDTANWCVARFYDDAISPSGESAAITASPAPPSWTSAAWNQWDAALSSQKAASATAGPTSTPTSNGYSDQRCLRSVRMWVLATMMAFGLGFVW
ncbi:hypothetical protein GGR54DRAFT_326632 [Hypoxylon sp. NC1633]|nr:hypothetical protein GGR54DRAFT_326632 [Hypoxylon sp. NC1633]